MGRKKTRFVIVAKKKFFRTSELAGILDLTVAEVEQFAYQVGALYEIEGVRLVKWPRILAVTDELIKVIGQKDTEYVEINELAQKMGLKESVIRDILAGSHSSYRVGNSIIFDVKATEDFIKRTASNFYPKEVPSKKGLGTKFI